MFSNAEKTLHAVKWVFRVKIKFPMKNVCPQGLLRYEDVFWNRNKHLNICSQMGAAKCPLSFFFNYNDCRSNEIPLKEESLDGFFIFKKRFDGRIH